MISSYRSSSNIGNCNDDDNFTDDDEKNKTLHKFGMPPANNGGKGNKNSHHIETKNTSVSIVNGDISIQASNSYEVKNTSNITTATAPELSYELQKNGPGPELDILVIAQRLYPNSDIWVCKNCNERGDRWHILNHLPNCKMNKKQ